MQLKSLVEAGRHDLIYFSANPLALYFQGHPQVGYSHDSKRTAAVPDLTSTLGAIWSQRGTVSTSSQQDSLWTKIICCSVAKSCPTL